MDQVYLWPHTFLTWAVDVGVVSFILMLFYPREKSPSIFSVGGWLGTRGGLDAV